jgi:peptidoglycan/LPS O-acetylase OafA/YrhL
MKRLSPTLTLVTAVAALLAAVLQPDEAAPLDAHTIVASQGWLIDLGSQARDAIATDR